MHSEPVTDPPVSQAPAGVSVLVCSCDRYADLWRPFFEIFRIRWPQCPWPLYLGSNHRRFEGQGVTTLAIGPDRAWGQNLLAMLDGIQTPRALLMLEDFLIRKPVDSERVAALAAVAARENLACLRLVPMPRPSKRVANYAGLGEIRPGDEYRVSTQAALWNVADLRRLLRPQFSAWQFEQLGSILSERLMPGGFWGTYEPAIDYLHGVDRGLWLPRGLEICRQAGVQVDIEARGAVGPHQFAARRRRTFFYALYRLALPRGLQRWLRHRQAASALRELEQQP